jgi:hypothetical protein
MSAASIITQLMSQLERERAENEVLRGDVEALKEENHALWAELHLRDDVDAALLCIPEKRLEVAQTYIARATYRLANKHRPAQEIKAAVLAEAARVDYPSKAAVALAGAILDAWAVDHG